MVKCTKGQVRRLKTALRWKGDPQRRQRIQMVLLRESEMTQPAIAGALGVSLSTVKPGAHGPMTAAGSRRSIQAERRTQAREHNPGRGKGLTSALCQAAGAGEM